MEIILKELGFKSKEEWSSLVSSIDLSTREKLLNFENWKNTR